MDAVLAIDAGGTKTRLQVQSQDGTDLARQILPTRTHDYSLAHREIVEATQSLTRNCRLVAVGAGVAGAIEDGTLTGSGNLPGWAGKKIQTDLENAFGVPATVFNDAQAAALGEYAAFGRPLVYVIWGTGVGAALVIDGNGHPVALATELGHIIIDQKSLLKCGCGGYGHLEALVSGGNIPNRRFEGQSGFEAADLTDRQWSEVLRDMAVGLRSISAGALGLPIVLGGGVATKQSHRLPELQSWVSRLPSSFPAPVLHLAKHGEASGLVGAGSAAWRLVTA